jgi:hypothetical protein
VFIMNHYIEHSQTVEAHTDFSKNITLAVAHSSLLENTQRCNHICFVFFKHLM